MKITVGGMDRSGDVVPQIVADAAQLTATRAIGMLAPDHTALRLKASADLDDYVGRFVDLLRIRHGIRTADYYIPRGPKLRGKLAAAMKNSLWKLLRYQHDRIAFQQSAANELAIHALEFQAGRIAELERRLVRIEKSNSAAP